MRILLHRFLSCVVVCLYVGWSMAFTSPSLPNFQTDWTTALNSWGQMKDNGTLSSIEVIINRLLLLATTGENYIVVLNINITEDEFKQHLSWLESHLYTNTQYLGRISQRYDFGGNQSFYGYSGTFNGALLDLIKAIPLVKVVVRDEIVQTQQITNSQMTAPWGLARICQRNSLGGKATGTFTFNRKAGANVDAYILDTGVYVEHSDFHGRARYPSDLTPPGPDKNLNDDNGHGTHVAGIVGSSTYGVAKSVNIIAVKVLGANGRGAWSGVIAGIDYVVKKFKALRRHSIINISISGPRNAALNQALDAAANQGVHVVVASGNDGKDACTTSPGSARNVISVGASTATDAVADFSNFGSCVTLVAPGNSILSVGTGSPSASRYMSGTSMASPHVTGALAVILSEQPKLVAPSVLRRYIISLASKNVLRADNPGSRDLLYLPSNPI